MRPKCQIGGRPRWRAGSTRLARGRDPRGVSVRDTVQREYTGRRVRGIYSALWLSRLTIITLPTLPSSCALCLPESLASVSNCIKRVTSMGVDNASAGLAIYRAALTDPAVQQVTLLTRRAVPAWAQLPPNATEKTETIIHTDFKTYPPDLARRLAEHDALIWALGRSAVGMSEEDYTELTYEYTLSAARALKEAGAGTAEKPFRFVFISGEGADPTGKSGQMWARVKVCSIRARGLWIRALTRTVAISRAVSSASYRSFSRAQT